MSISSKSPRFSFVRITSFALIIGLVLAANASAGSGYAFVDSIAAFFGVSAETAASVTTAPERAAALAIPLDTRTVCNTGTPDFASMASAVADANAAVPAGGRTYLVCAGHTETAPAGGFVITATGASAANPVVFVKDGVGANPTFTASAALTAGILHDAIFEIVGADYITIDGFTMLENGANTTTTAASNNMTEWGVALLYASTTNGAQNITLQNNTITLNRTYQNTFGIYSNSVHTALAVTTSASATTAAGGNSGLKVYGNTVSNVNNGIVVVGPTAAADANTGIDIGGTGGAQANSITNFGTTSSFSGYANVSLTVNGILVRNSNGSNISFNTVTSSVGGTTAGTLNGIQIPAASAAPTTTFTNNINSNVISLQGAVAAGAMNGINYPSGSASATSVLNVNSNNFHTFGHTVASSGGITFITVGSTNLTTSISSNTFTNMSVNTTGSITFISNSITVPAGGSQTINSNSIVTSFTRTSAGSTTGITTGGSSTTVTSNWNNNNFSNISLTGASGLTFINQTDGGSVNHNITGNTFSNVTGGTSAIVGINSSFGGTNGGNGNLVSGNTITGISCACAISGITIGSSGTNSTVTGNTIGSLSSTGASAVIGITSAAPTSNTISKNKIYDLSGTNAASTVIGIAVTAGSSHTLSNNIVGNLTAPAATVTSPASAIIGINLTSTSTSSTINVFYNTVYINAVSSGANFGTTGIFHLASTTATTAALNLRNNIIDNRSTPNGTGLTVAYRRSSGLVNTLANYAGTSNNNLFYSGTPSATSLIYSDGTSTAQTMAQYKAGVFTAGTIAPRDSASFTENPPFLSTTGSNANFLHINAATPTQIESGAAPIAGITDDFDGNTRNVTTPDVGADEGAFTALDLSAPSISYTPLPNTAAFTNRILSAAITDPSGVAGGGNSPRIYFKKSTDAGYVSTQCTGSYSCAIDYTLVGGGSVTTGDIVQYFVVAQDTAGNVGANPSGGFSATDVNSVTSAPTTPSSYTIVTGFTGTHNVGAGETYTSLTNPGGIFEAINNAVVTGAVTLNITSDLTGETGTVALNQWTEEGLGGWHMTIKPSGAPRSVTSSTGALRLIALNGADRVTIDGSTSGGTDRSLTLFNQNTTTSGTTVVSVLSLGAGAGATNNTIKNCVIQNGTAFSATTSSFNFGIFAGASASASGPDNDNLTVQNNLVQRTNTGMQIIGAAGALLDNLVVQDNIVGGSAGADFNGLDGMIIGQATGAAVRRNTVRNQLFTAALDGRGITLSLGVINSSVTRNSISNLEASNSGGYGMTGIQISNAAAAANNLVANNFVYDIRGTGWTTGVLADTVVGIRVSGSGTGGVKIYNNSVNLFGGYAGSATTATVSAALMVNGTSVTGLDIRNNSFANTFDNSATATDKSYAIYTSSANTMFSAINYNDYYVSGTAPGVLGAINSVDAATLGALATATSGDASSISANPNYSSNTDLHIAGAPLQNSGQTLGDVTDDYDGDSRPQGAAYEIGADENEPVSTPTSTNTATATSTATFTATATATASCTPAVYVNTTAIAVPGTGSGASTGSPADLYPSDITVSGLSGSIYKVTVKLNALSHTYPDDIDVLLVGPGGNAMIMSDAGGSSAVTGVSFTLDSDASVSITSPPVDGSTYTPTNNGVGDDPFPTPAPTPVTGDSTLAAFVGTNPNGTWSLYVVDDAGGDTGSFAGGWELSITTDNCPAPTSTNTDTPTPTATETFTPTPSSTATSTATDTPTSTPSETATATATNTPTPPIEITGTVNYGNPVTGPNPRGVPNVLISGAGSPPVSDTTTASGTYLLTGFGALSYTVTPSKSGGDNGSITSFDSARIVQYITGATGFTAAQLTVADVTGAGGVSSFDAAMIARFVALLGPPQGNTGTWLFNPVSRFYASVPSSISNEDYAALLMGDVSGNWGDPSPYRPAFGPERLAAVTAPRLTTSADGEVIVPLRIEGASNKDVISYEFDLRYDPSVIQPQENPVDVVGTLSGTLFTVANAETPGLLRVVVYGATPLDGAGVLLNLRFTAVGKPGMVSPLTWERLLLNEGTPRVTAADGQIELVRAVAPNQAEITGRLLDTFGAGVPNSRVFLTDATGQSRSILSDGFGVYRFAGLQLGQTYTLNVKSGAFTYTPLTISVTGQSITADMIAEQ